MKERFWLVIASMLIVAVCSACVPRGDNCCPDPNKTVSGIVVPGLGSESRQGCTLPPQPFKDSDLVGTWIARTVTITDAIMLSADHNYIQRYNNSITGDTFETQAQKWWVEYRDGGRPYVHLTGMHKCDDLNQCRQQGGGGGNRLWYDFCERRVIKMPNEVILMVLGVPEARRPKATWSIELFHLMADPDTTPTFFEPLQ